jgi:hypothetical protein
LPGIRVVAASDAGSEDRGLGFGNMSIVVTSKAKGRYRPRQDNTMTNLL